MANCELGCGAAGSAVIASGVAASIEPVWFRYAEIVYIPRPDKCRNAVRRLRPKREKRNTVSASKTSALPGCPVRRLDLQGIDFEENWIEPANPLSVTSGPDAAGQ